MSRILHKFSKLYHLKKNPVLLRRNFLTHIDEISKISINIVPFCLVMSVTGGLWCWESYQQLQELKTQVVTFQLILQNCLEKNTSCDSIQSSINTLFQKNKSDLLVRVNTKNKKIELIKQDESDDKN